MAVPKKRTSRSKKSIRKASWKNISKANWKRKVFESIKKHIKID
jgi:ribosomal protein L32